MSHDAAQRRRCGWARGGLLTRRQQIPDTDGTADALEQDELEQDELEQDELEQDELERAPVVLAAATSPPATATPPC